jgi:dissimilatory sulfite reductase (desulfoviridin) alpha/beta subunit
MSKLEWESQAQEALKRVPVFVRPLARRKIEERVGLSGRSLVTLADFAEAEARFKAVTAGKSADQLKALLPAANEPGAEMVVLEACRASLAGCPNPLMDVDAWRGAVENWSAASGLSERLRGRVRGDQVLFHHKLKIAIAGCPNGCSRPQIADLALVGLARPVFGADDCTACGACAEACPDEALTVDEAPPLWQAKACLGCLGCAEACPAGCVSLHHQGARLFLGGKLGRHPRLAVPAGEYADPAQAVAAMDEAVRRYLNEARPGERFAAWHQRQVS